MENLKRTIVLMHPDVVLIGGSLLCLTVVGFLIGCLQNYDLDLEDNKNKNKDKTQDQDKDQDQEGPRAKYSDRYSLAGPTPEETEENKGKQQVEDEIENSGRVVLKSAEDGFEYWADKAVAYPDLEALARKWVLVFNQLSAYKERSRVVTTKEPAPVKAQDQVFAVLKTYQTTPAVTVKEQANTYRWRGKLRDIPVPETDPKPAPKPIKYGDFKKNVDQS